VDDETALLQGATPAQIAAVPFENKEERCFADGLGYGLGWFFDAPVNSDKSGIDEQRVAWRFISADPEHIGKREVLEAGKFVE